MWGGAFGCCHLEGLVALSTGRCCLGIHPWAWDMQAAQLVKGCWVGSATVWGTGLRGQDSRQLSPADSMAPAPCPAHDSEQNQFQTREQGKEGLKFLALPTMTALRL